MCCTETNEGYEMVHCGTEDTSELEAKHRDVQSIIIYWFYYRLLI